MNDTRTTNAAEWAAHGDRRAPYRRAVWDELRRRTDAGTPLWCLQVEEVVPATYDRPGGWQLHTQAFRITEVEKPEEWS